MHYPHDGARMFLWGGGKGEGVMRYPPVHQRSMGEHCELPMQVEKNN